MNLIKGLVVKPICSSDEKDKHIAEKAVQMLKKLQQKETVCFHSVSFHNDEGYFILFTDICKFL